MVFIQGKNWYLYPVVHSCITAMKSCCIWGEDAKTIQKTKGHKCSVEAFDADTEESCGYD